MKSVLSIVLQFILYLVIFGVGSLLPAFNVLPTWSLSTGPGRVFVYDGLLLALALYILILVIAATRRRIAISLPNASIALVLAIVIGLLMKFGFKSI
jgi:hypothetical protein